MVLLLFEITFFIFQFRKISEGCLEYCLIAYFELLQLLYYLILPHNFILFFAFQHQNVFIDHFIELIVELFDCIAYLLVLSDYSIHIELLQHPSLVVWTVFFSEVCVFIGRLLLFLIYPSSRIERSVMRSCTVSSVDSGWTLAIFHHWLRPFSILLNLLWKINDGLFFHKFFLSLFRFDGSRRGFLFLMSLKVFLILRLLKALICVFIKILLTPLLFQCGSTSFYFLLTLLFLTMFEWRSKWYEWFLINFFQLVHL